MSRLQQRIQNFNKSFEILSEAVKEYNPDKILTHMALIQSFEVAFELAWKVLKDYLNKKGVVVYLPKDVIKEAFSNEVIKDGQIWIDMLDARNASSHEYNTEKVNIILEKIITTYFEELKNFQNNLGAFDE